MINHLLSKLRLQVVVIGKPWLAVAVVLCGTSSPLGLIYDISAPSSSALACFYSALSIVVKNLRPSTDRKEKGEGSWSTNISSNIPMLEVARVLLASFLHPLQVLPFVFDFLAITLLLRPYDVYLLIYFASSIAPQNTIPTLDSVFACEGESVRCTACKATPQRVVDVGGEDEDEMWAWGTIADVLSTSRAHC
ncbi:hypothetical protein C8J57DRAFT_1556861 [Mycena rebaudengoi]|nr:hypothetical protein C8J57DRAFT_1556861 [Mycena rebaudengoi]